MESLFIKYKQALELKELGFDETCLAFYWNTGKFYTTAEYPHSIETHKQNQLGDYNYDSTSAPTYSQAFRWFREKYGIKTYIYEILENRFVYIRYTNQLDYKMSSTYHETYEEAELECLKKLIEIRQSQKTSDESPHTRTFRTPSSDYNSRGQYRK